MTQIQDNRNRVRVDPENRNTQNVSEKGAPEQYTKVLTLPGQPPAQGSEGKGMRETGQGAREATMQLVTTGVSKQRLGLPPGFT